MKPKKARFDVLGLGTVAVDELIVADRYPAADAKTRVQTAERQCGGLTAIALIAATRLGARCAYAGVLGNDELSHFAIEQLRREKIDLRSLRVRTDAPPVHSFIIIDAQTQTRNVFSHRAVDYKVPANWPPKALIESSRVLFVDHSDLTSMIRAAKIARAMGVPVVADLERDSGPRFHELVDLVDHLILSEAFALKWTGARTVAGALKELSNGERALVAITCGERGSFFLETTRPNQIVHQPAFNVRSVDTTGCGDVFHGAYAAALAKGLLADERIRFAAAAAALKAERLGAQAGIPTQSAVRKFLKRQKTQSQD
jgi:sulfofructose kinase